MPARIQGVNTRAQTQTAQAARPAPRLPSYPGAVLRKDVKPGDVFRKVLNGHLGNERYGSVGMNGTLYSINMRTGNTAASQNPNGEVKVVGTYTLSANRWPTSQHRTTTRGKLGDGAVFVVAKKVKVDYGKAKLYAHLDRLNNGDYLGINLASGDNTKARSAKANKAVVQVGEFTICPN